MRSLTALSAFLDVSSLNLAVLQGTAIFSARDRPKVAHRKLTPECLLASVRARPGAPVGVLWLPPGLFRAAGQPRERPGDAIPIGLITALTIKAW
jgi:hypothetical protein